MPAAPFFLDTTPGPQPGDPIIAPWRVVPADPTHSGKWVVLGDVDGDGAVEVVSARNVDVDDIHYTSTVVAQRLDGSVIWRWGDPTIGRRKLHHDVACQLHDWNGDGRLEVIIATAGALIELDGATGAELRRIALPPDATDCVTFANLTGGPAPRDVLVKDRYHTIWALDLAGDLLWTVTDPAGYPTAHQPYPIDLDGTGRDSIMAGNALLNSDGSVRWVLDVPGLIGGHLDCCRVLSPGPTPADFRLACTLCGANVLLVCDGEGKLIWQATGEHYEFIDIGRLRADIPGPQLLVDIDKASSGQCPTCLFDASGNLLGTVIANDSRHHELVDWNGDGLDEVVLAGAPAICDGNGNLVARLQVDDPDLATVPHGDEVLVRVGDFDGDGRPDIAICTTSAVYLFRNESAAIPNPPARLGTGLNATLY